MNTEIDVSTSGVSGEFVDFADERYYAIRNVDKMAPFFISVISNVDDWLFASSSGGLTAGRVSPDTALFPYIPDDKIHECTPHTGCKTLLRVCLDGKPHSWEPFNREHDGRFEVSRNIYKNIPGNKLCFEEINHDLGLAYRYTWCLSDEYGFIRACELECLATTALSVEMFDGLQNVLPAGAPRLAQSSKSNLIDAYKWTELDSDTGLAFFALYSGISDRAEPCESLKANVIFCLGLDHYQVLISNDQLNDFRMGGGVNQETHKRGIRGAYFVNSSLQLGPGETRRWQFVANIELTQDRIVDLRHQLGNPAKVDAAINESIKRGSDELLRIMAGADGLQSTAEENVSVHHYANVLFNVLRGGFFFDQYRVSVRDFTDTLRNFNRDVFAGHQAFLSNLPESMTFSELLAAVKQQADIQLERLCCEYLPITFGRRHGDPSRPWNEFAINLKDETGNPLLSYEGNWRDIFQNWEALSFSYPGFIENVIAKFVNASTVDGYNPYRITKEGIDWEVEEPDDPWSYIGYWGDHQIIYLLKLLELSNRFHPTQLGELMHRSVFSYANVPYRIKPFEALLKNPKDTVEFDTEMAGLIDQRIESMGADGKLVLDSDNQVYQVNLAEKLLVPLLSKLGNLVVDGGIWLNTQRPEWNDANNALVGQGLSMVTLYYLRRYVAFMQQLLDSESGEVELSNEVCQWLTDTAAALNSLRPLLNTAEISPQQRFASLQELGQAASRHRLQVYAQGGFSGKQSAAVQNIMAMLDDARAVIDHSIAGNVRDDGLYHAYNLMIQGKNELTVDNLYPMLEGQVSVLSSGAIAPDEAVAVLEALFASSVYRADQLSFMLYPNRELPGFLAKNIISQQQVESIPLLNRLVSSGDETVLVLDAEGTYRFNAEFRNVADLVTQLDKLAPDFGAELDSARQPICDLYEDVFDHRAFTGRSGTMFGFEGLGCIYWHMVAKLLLAVQENFFMALQQGTDLASCQRLGQLYYRVREGIGFNKTPQEFGAFPTDPYSHSPAYAGARQPGMTGQVKEEVLCRFGELGILVDNGTFRVEPGLLRAREFLSEACDFRFLDVDNNWQTLIVPSNGLAFSWCQVPVIYQIVDAPEPGISLLREDGSRQSFAQLELPAKQSVELFERSGKIRQLVVSFNSNLLFE